MIYYWTVCVPQGLVVSSVMTASNDFKDFYGGLESGRSYTILGKSEMSELAWLFQTHIYNQRVPTYEILSFDVIRRVPCVYYGNKQCFAAINFELLAATIKVRHEIKQFLYVVRLNYNYI